jgi:hypothetical protein
VAKTDTDLHAQTQIYWHAEIGPNFYASTETEGVAADSTYLDSDTEADATSDSATRKIELA